jgi:hypothetical protein
VLTWSRGSIGFLGEVFGVMTQVDLGLTSVGRFDSADSPLVLMTLIKNLGRHNCLAWHLNSCISAELLRKVWLLLS